MMDLNKLIDEYIEAYGVKFEIVARDKTGRVISKSTSTISADDVAMDAWKIDESVKQAALDELDDKAELEIQVVEDAIREAV